MNDFWKYIGAPIIVALVVGGTAPWWLATFFANQSEETAEVDDEPDEYSDSSSDERDVEDAQPNEQSDYSEEEEFKEDAPEPQSTSIQILYRGDNLYCNLATNIVVGGKPAAFVQQNQFVVDDIGTGSQLYSISGQVNCPQTGSCMLGGEGTINVAENSSYYLVWQGGAGTGRCVATLQT